MATEKGDLVFTALCPYLLGPNLGSKLAITGRRLPELDQLRNNIAAGSVHWFYWHWYKELLLSDSCMQLMLKNCDTESVLLIPETE